MLTGFRAFAVFGLIFGLLSLAGCAVEATPAPGAAAPPPATVALAPAPSATATSVPAPAGPTPGATRTAPSTPVATASPILASSATPQPSAGSGGAVVVSSPVAAGSSGPLSSLTPAPTRGVVPVPVNGQITVTLVNNGATLKLHPGDRFVMMLGDAYNWEVTPEDPSIVSRVVNITPVKGSQGVYEAHQAGQTTIDASGDPFCRQSQPPCMMPSIVFTLKIVVE